MDKAPDAFRTISEVADHLETPAHVLRFWESRFPQIRPVKRAGGRRYYRPADVALLTGIKRLLHDEGLTIRGVQKILREQGVRHVAGLSGDVLPEDIDLDADAALSAAMAANFGGVDDAPVPPERAESATVVALETALQRAEAAAVKRAGLTQSPVATSPTDITEDSVVSGFLADPVAADLVDNPDIAQDASGSRTDATGSPHNFDPVAKADLAAMLRALPARAFADHQVAATAIYSRLVTLQARLQAPPSFAKF